MIYSFLQEFFGQKKALAWIFTALFLLSGRSIAQEGTAQILKIKLLDPASKPVVNAKVFVTDSSGNRNDCRPEDTGFYKCNVNAGKSSKIQISVPGFADVNESIDSLAGAEDFREIKLSFAGLKEQIIVSAARTETKIGETPASVTTFSCDDLETAAAPTVDDVLRQAVGFSIFRRSSSRNANPTTQGVSLRGVGASGASRSRVLLDEVPLNDIFGGWVQWERVIPAATERIEVLRGGASSLYGDAGLSGAVNIIPRQVVDKLVFSGEGFGGTQKTLSGSTFIGFSSGPWNADTALYKYQTRGFIAVDESQRGPADVYFGTRDSSYSARLSRKLVKSSVIFVRPSYFGEVRTNGTGIQTNRTHIRQIIVGGDFAFLGGNTGLKDSRIAARIFGGTQVYDQIFSTVNAARTNESLLRLQRVPAQNFGLSVQFSGHAGSNSISAGVESQQVRGASDEIAIANNSPTSLVGAGGRQRTTGVYVQDFIRAGERVVIAGFLRFDSWKNYRGLNSTRFLATNQQTTNIFPDRGDEAISPNISVLYHVTDSVGLYGGFSRSFRSPTLNELYRSFRVGNVLTQSNENLRAERANNFEFGATYGRKNTYLRSSAFFTTIDQPIANVTLATTPTLITRQRQNAGRTRSNGFEVEAETTFGKVFLSAGYLFVDSIVTRFPSNPALVGLKIPQVASHQYSLQSRFRQKQWTFALQARGSSSQFDDDLNTFLLEPYFQADVYTQRAISERASIFIGIENIFNTRYSVGKTPIRTVSSPTNIRIGFRWK